MNVGIIGGSDGLGKTLIYYFREEFEVYITGTDHKKGRGVADELNVNYIESNIEIADISDILVISVPIQYTSDVIREVAPFMKSGSLMVDVTSVKEEPLKTMQEVLPDTVEYLPTHPSLVHALPDLTIKLLFWLLIKRGNGTGKLIITYPIKI